MLTDFCKLCLSMTFAFCCLIPQYMSALGFSQYDGNDMLKDCKAWVRLMDTPNSLEPNTPDGLQAAARGDDVNGAHCLGYVQGVIDDHFIWQMYETSSSAALDPTKHFCLPDGVTPNQTVRVILKWLEDHPARLHERAVELALAALRENFPCKQKH